MSPADLATHTIQLMTPDGPRDMFRVGNKVYDNHGTLQDGELVPFIRGMVPTTTDREVMGLDANGLPAKYLLRSTRSINLPGGTPSPVANPSATAAPTGAPVPSTGGIPAPPAAPVRTATSGGTGGKQPQK